MQAYWQSFFQHFFSENVYFGLHFIITLLNFNWCIINCTFKLYDLTNFDIHIETWNHHHDRSSGRVSWRRWRACLEGQQDNDSQRGQRWYSEPEFRFPELLALEVGARTCSLVDRAPEESLVNKGERPLPHLPTGSAGDSASFLPILWCSSHSTLYSRCKSPGAF